MIARCGFLVLGQTGVGKSSLVNSGLGRELAQCDAFEACTQDVCAYAAGTDFGTLGLIDTPGLSEGGIEADLKHLAAIRSGVDFNAIRGILYVSRLDSTRMRNDEISCIRLLTSHLGVEIWAKSSLVLTFAASHSDSTRAKQATFRLHSIAQVIGDAIYDCDHTRRFAGFKQTLLIDNVIQGWCKSGRTLASFLVE